MARYFLQAVLAFGVAGWLFTSSALATPVVNLSDRMVILFDGDVIFSGEIAEPAAGGTEDPLIATIPTSGGASFPDAAVALLEPGSNAISDLIWLHQTVTGQQFVITFWSDSEDPFVTTIPITARLFETGQMQDITEELGLGGPNSLYQVLVGSDVEQQPPVPEPASMALVALGLSGVGYLRRRKARLA